MQKLSSPRKFRPGLSIRIEKKRPIVLWVNGKRVEIWHDERNRCRIDAPPEVIYEPHQEPGTGS